MAETLIVGDVRDPHIVAVQDLLRRRNRPAHVFSRYDSRCRMTISFGIEQQPVISVTIDGVPVNCDRISSIWWRPKPFTSFYPSDPERNNAQDFIRREWNHVLGCLPTFFENAKWVNPISKALVASAKPVGLNLAVQAGFSIPRTSFTNDMKVVSAACDNYDLVYKPLHGYLAPDSKTIFTTRIDKDQLLNADEIGIAPGIYQEHVEKLFEVRIYFIHDTVFTIKIDSQVNPSTKHDWREDQYLDIHELIETDASWKSKVVAYSKLSGLVYGAIDAIITPSGELVFLECNPAGQWLWQEKATGAPIADAIAQALSC